MTKEGGGGGLKFRAPVLRGMVLVTFWGEDVDVEEEGDPKGRGLEDNLRMGTSSPKGSVLAVVPVVVIGLLESFFFFLHSCPPLLTLFPLTRRGSAHRMLFALDLGSPQWLLLMLFEEDNVRECLLSCFPASPPVD